MVLVEEKERKRKEKKSRFCVFFCLKNTLERERENMSKYDDNFGQKVKHKSVRLVNH